MLFGRDKQEMPDPADALPGRPDPVPVPDAHLVLGTPLAGPYPEGMESALFGPLARRKVKAWNTAMELVQ